MQETFHAVTYYTILIVPPYIEPAYLSLGSPRNPSDLLPLRKAWYIPCGTYHT